MSELAGYGGGVLFSDAAITLTNSTYNLHSWSLDVKCEALDVTGFADGGDKTFIRGLKEWSASVDAYVDDTNHLQPSDVGCDARLYLYTFSDTKSYNGPALLTGINPAVSVAGLVTQTLTFQGYSDLTLTVP